VKTQIHINVMHAIDRQAVRAGDSTERAKEYIREHLAADLMRQILDQKDFFDTLYTEDSIQITAQCFVLTPAAFRELVRDIRRYVEIGGRWPLYPGISSVQTITGEDSP